MIILNIKKKEMNIQNGFKMENKIDELIESVLLTRPIFWDNPNGGYRYTCPFCYVSKEVKTSEFVGICDLNHSEDCTYILAEQLHKLKS